MPSSEFLEEFFNRLRINNCIPLYETCSDNRVCTAEYVKDGFITRFENATSCESIGYCVATFSSKVTVDQCIQTVLDYNVDTFNYPQCSGCQHGELCFPLVPTREVCSVDIPKVYCDYIYFSLYLEFPQIIWDEKLGKCIVDPIKQPNYQSSQCYNFKQMVSMDPTYFGLAKNGYCPSFDFDRADVTNLVCQGNYVNDPIALEIRRQLWTQTCPGITDDEFIAIDKRVSTFASFPENNFCLINGAPSSTICSLFLETNALPKMVYDMRVFLNAYYFNTSTVNIPVISFPDNPFFDNFVRKPTFLQEESPFKTTIAREECDAVKSCISQDRKVMYNNDCDQVNECIGKTCSTCVADTEFDNYVDVCVSNSLTECECYKQGGMWEITRDYFKTYDATVGFCLFNLEKEACRAAGHVYASCSDLKETECDKCSNFNFEKTGKCPWDRIVPMRCAWKEAPCTSDQCTSYCKGMEKFPACVVPNAGFIDTSSCLACPFNLAPSMFGCLNMTDGLNTVAAKTYCNSINGRWIEKATTQQECESYVGCELEYSQGCNTTLRNFGGLGYHLIDITGGLTPSKNCFPPDGFTRKLFKWVTPFNTTPERLENHWFENIWEPQNDWTTQVSFTQLQTKIQEAIFFETSHATSTYELCRYNSTYEYVNALLCDCDFSFSQVYKDRIARNNTKNSTDTVTVQNCFEELNQVEIGNFRFCYGKNATLELGK